MEVIIIPVTDSPLRYPGGKTQLKNFVSDILNVLSLHKDSIYVEPFAGGAGIALSLLFSKQVEKIHINDIDTAIYCFWSSVLTQTDDFISKIVNTPITIDEWNRQREILLNRNSHSMLEIGFSTFFLNRTNVSGIIKGGPIGGKEQKGNYKLNCRFNKQNLIKKIYNISKYKNRISVSNLDASLFIDKEISKMNPDKTFIFFDPPYYHQGQNLYSNFYNHDDHVNLSHKILSLHQYYWITTYDYSSEITTIYKNENKKIYSLRYSANEVKKAKELMIFSNKLGVPISNNIQFLNTSL